MATIYRDAEAEFGDFIRAQGLVLNDLPVMDGRVHRVASEEGRRGNKDGAYKGYLDGRPSGWVMNYRNGEDLQKWSAERTAPIPPADQAAQRARWKVQQAHKEAQAQAEYRKAADLSQEIWASLNTEPVNADRTYLHRKQVQGLGVRFAGDDVVVPVRDVDGKLWSLQTIKADTQAERAKDFTLGGRLMGNMHVIGELENGKPILIAEGYATAASIAMASQQAVVVAFNAGNLEPVAEQLKGKYPDSPLLILADDDKHRDDGRNPGLDKALSVAAKTGAAVMAPQFAQDAKGRTDFNDLHVQEGLDAVRTQVLAELELVKQEAAMRLLKQEAADHQAAPVPDGTAQDAPTDSNSEAQTQATTSPPPEIVQNAIEPQLERITPNAQVQPEKTVAKDDKEKSEPTQADEAKPPTKEAETTAEVPKREEDAKDHGFVPPPGLAKRYLKAENRYYFRDDNKTLAFEDQGEKLMSEHTDVDVARSMVELAQAKQWTVLKLSGTDDFKREAWLEASLRNLETKGYEPRDMDKARLAEIRKERSSRETKTAKRSATPGSNAQAARAPSPAETNQAPSDERKLTPEQAIAVAALQMILKNRGDSDQEVAAAVSIATERFQNNRVYVGKLLEHGAARYEFDPDNGESHFVRLQTAQGEKVIWGVDLERAITVNQVKMGDEVAIAYQGKTHTIVPVKERDASGLEITTERNTWRNTWAIEKVEKLRADARVWLNDAAERTAKQPVVKVFDPKAPRQAMTTAQHHQMPEQGRGR